MSYAVKKDGSAWRAVDSAAGCTSDETFSEIQPEIKVVDNSASIRLIQIDQETMRPLRAVYAGTATQTDHDKLTTLETEAIQLRGELNAH
jgi:hypothetical protein